MTDTPEIPRTRLLKNGNRAGDPANAARCSGVNGRGTPCGSPAMKNGFCVFHGGVERPAPEPPLVVFAGLDGRRENFCQEYLIDLNGKEAATRAGYSPKSAHVRASHLLADPKVASRIAELRNRMAEKTEITVQRIIEEYAAIAFLDPRKLFDAQGGPVPITELDDSTARAIAALETATESSRGEDGATTIRKYKLSDKRAALDSLARHLGMFVDRQQITGKDDGPVQVTHDLSSWPDEALALQRKAYELAKMGKGE